MEKQKYSLIEQIQHMEGKGITFNLIKHDEVIEFLQESNYYFRIKSYAKNYAKYAQTEKKGQYINLDFAYLKELSIIDLYLRRILLKMSIDIEHTLKVKFLDDVLNTDDNDGYDIVQVFLQSPLGAETQKHLIKMNTLYTSRDKGTYTSNLYIKYHPHYPIWCLVELLSFGEFIKLYTFYYSIYYAAIEKKKAPFAEFLWSTRIIRNACAHNNCLLNNLSYERNTLVSNKLRKVLRENEKTRRYYYKYKNNYLIMDILSVCYLYSEIVNNAKGLSSTLDELGKIVDRVFEKSYFAQNTLIRECFELFSLVLENIQDLEHF